MIAINWWLLIESYWLILYVSWLKLVYKKIFWNQLNNVNWQISLQDNINLGFTSQVLVGIAQIQARNQGEPNLVAKDKVFLLQQLQ